MQKFSSLTPSELEDAFRKEAGVYEEYKAQGLDLNMARGLPSREQLDLSTPMLSVLHTGMDCIDAEGADCRNYGQAFGIPEAVSFMSGLLDDEPELTVVFGNSSLNSMYSAIGRAFDFGCLGSRPWSAYEKVKWICPVPGYDRHFAICEQFGIEMISVKMDENGPDMDAIERLVGEDETIKGIWAVPKYSNPSGAIYSDETVRRLASMECKAGDFRIFWDNAYCVHSIYGSSFENDVLDIARACQEAGNEDRCIKFASTAKITFPGSGVAAFSASEANIEEAKRIISRQMIGSDKLAQLRLVRFLPDKEALLAHMHRHSELLRPKFELVQQKLSEALGGLDIARWTHPEGGYFVLFNSEPGCAKRIVELAREAGVKLTDAGATWPYGVDPHDSDIRIAPTYPPLEDLSRALDVFTTCVKLATLEKMTAL